MSVEQPWLDGQPAPGNVANSLLYNGSTASLIENAVGGSGSDWLTANDVSNKLTGGGGADHFMFNSLSASIGLAPDTIQDFQQADVIDLGQIDARPDAGDQDFVWREHLVSYSSLEPGQMGFVQNASGR